MRNEVFETKKEFKKQFVVIYFVFLALLIVALVNLFVYKNLVEKNKTLNAPPSATSSIASNSAMPSSPQATATPPATPTPEPKPITATVVSTGDCVLHKAFQESAHLKNQDKYDFTYIFDAIKPYTEPADLSFISFESAATNSRNDYTGYPTFNCPPEIFSAFKAVGLDIVNNSNNHQLDRKVKGMLETRQNIRNAGLEVIGAYDGEEPRYMIKDINGIKVGIMAYTYSCNMNEKALTLEQQARYIALFDEKRMERELKELEGKDDITIVLIHWGTEYTQKPNEVQKQLAKKMINWGADVILGSHPHVVQPSETVEFNGETKYIIYSMGNFVSNQRRGASGYPKTHKELSEDGMLVKLVFEKDPTTRKTVIKEVDHIPTWLWRYEEKGSYRFKIIPVPSPDFYKNGEYPKSALAEAYASYKRTMSLVTDYPGNK